MAWYRNKKERLLVERGEGVARVYSAWIEMRRRISHPYGNNSCYAGLSIDPRWNDFETFLADMGEPPAGLSLDRIDNAVGYTPDNCRWVGPTEQSRNRNYVKMSVDLAEEVRQRYCNEKISQQKLANEYGVTQRLISFIINGEHWQVP